MGATAASKVMAMKVKLKMKPKVPLSKQAGDNGPSIEGETMARRRRQRKFQQNLRGEQAAATTPTLSSSPFGQIVSVLHQLKCKNEKKNHP